MPFPIVYLQEEHGCDVCMSFVFSLDQGRSGRVTPGGD